MTTLAGFRTDVSANDLTSSYWERLVLGEISRLRFRVSVSGLTVALVSAVPIEGVAQGCGASSAGPNEVWVAAVVGQGPDEMRKGASASFNLMDRLVVTAAAGSVGYDTGQRGGGRRRFEIGAPIDIGTFTICPGLSSELMSYRFNDRFEADRGEVQELRNSLLISIHRTLQFGGGRLRLRFSPRFVRRAWILESRTITVRDSVFIDLERRETKSWHVDGVLAISLSRGSLAVQAGVENRVERQRFFFAFFRLGYMLKRY